MEQKDGFTSGKRGVRLGLGLGSGVTDKVFVGLVVEFCYQCIVTISAFNAYHCRAHVDSICFKNNVERHKTDISLDKGVCSFIIEHLP
jgi:hypothetical protein